MVTSLLTNFLVAGFPEHVFAMGVIGLFEHGGGFIGLAKHIVEFISAA